MVNYGGDEIAALVVDIGTSSVRAGYAGDDAPKAIVPTSYGYMPESSQDGQDVSMEENGEANTSVTSKKRYHVGQHGPSLWRPGMEIGNPLSEGLITDFEPIQALITHSLKDVLNVDPADHPILVTEPAWNNQANRERMAEIMFEEMNVPAFYIANSGVLNAFAAGKGTALVIDIGMTNASVIPVVDGFVLRKGMQHNSLPRLVHSNAQHILMSPSRYRPAVDLLPHQLIATKMSPPETASYTLRDDRLSQTTDSWRAWAAEREVEEWIQAMGGCLDQAYNEQAAAARAPRPYEFPTGVSCFFGPERYRVGDLFFFHDQALQSANPNMPQPLPQLIASSLGACDPELRQQLLGNVVLTGGGSQFSGLSERLNNEMSRGFPGVKIHAPGNPIERRFGAWLGGSILASLGTFHQLWISKEEWSEHGRPIVGQRCK